MAAEVTRTRTLAQPPEAVWAALAAYDRIAAWAPQVDHATRLGGPPDGPGAVRRVQVGRLALVETVTDWEPGRHLAYRIEGLPRPLGRVATSWHLRPAGTGTEVSVTTTVDAGPRPPQQLIARIGARRLGAAGDQMLGGLAGHLDAGTTSGSPQGGDTTTGPPPAATTDGGTP
jgi:uncharacterized protein YndB with AHSA1/START domain